MTSDSAPRARPHMAAAKKAALSVTPLHNIATPMAATADRNAVARGAKKPSTSVRDPAGHRRGAEERGRECHGCTIRLELVHEQLCENAKCVDEGGPAAMSWDQ